MMRLFRTDRTALKQIQGKWCTCSRIQSQYLYNTFRTLHIQADSRHLPRIAQSSTWEAIFPKHLRERTRAAFRLNSKQPFNPATYFIWIYIFIGSQAIRIIGVQNEFTAYMRRAEHKIEKLREVVEKLQKGEPVDVEKVLGTGDEEQEQEWEEALREIENEDRIWQEAKRKRLEESMQLEVERQDANPVSESDNKIEKAPDLPSTLPPSPPKQPGFY